MYSQEATPKLRLYVSEYNGSNIEVSPDGTKFTFDTDDSSFRLFEITGFRERGGGNGDDEENEDNEDNEDEDNEDEELNENERLLEGSNIDDNKFSQELSTIAVAKNISTTTSSAEKSENETSK